MGRRNTQAHKTNKMGSLVRGGHSKSHDLQRLTSQGTKPTKRYTSQGSLQKIQLTNVQLQLDPTNECVCGIPLESQGKLAKLFQTSIERYNHHSTTKWLRYNDPCSKFFFDFHQISNKKRTLLKELEVLV